MLYFHNEITPTLIVLRLTSNNEFSGYEYISTRGSERIVCFTSLLLGLVLCEAYRNTLMSFLTTKRVEVPFNLLEEMIDKKTHELIVFKGGFAHEAFMVGTENSQLI